MFCEKSHPSKRCFIFKLLSTKFVNLNKVIKPKPLRPKALFLVGSVLLSKRVAAQLVACLPAILS
ncbi:hypothetical protein HanIR_Chr12g0569001 [Helianthus annuus]|nr:hypothetical protein HanIR_Chr12g0569001 [Helianthus annuus]